MKGIIFTGFLEIVDEINKFLGLKSNRLHFFDTLIKDSQIYSSFIKLPLSY